MTESTRRKTARAVRAEHAKAKRVAKRKQAARSLDALAAYPVNGFAWIIDRSIEALKFTVKCTWAAMIFWFVFAYLTGTSIGL